MKYLSAALITIMLTTFLPVAAEEGMTVGDAWLPSLITDTPEEGFALAITLSRKGVTTTQSDKGVLFPLRQAYSHDPDSLIAASHVIAVHFRTIAEANNFWRENP